MNQFRPSLILFDKSPGATQPFDQAETAALYSRCRKVTFVPPHPPTQWCSEGIRASFEVDGQTFKLASLFTALFSGRRGAVRQFRYLPQFIGPVAQVCLLRDT